MVRYEAILAEEETVLVQCKQAHANFIYNSAGWSSLVARRAHNPKVGGSNPSPATNSCCSNSVLSYKMDTSFNSMKWSGSSVG